MSPPLLRLIDVVHVSDPPVCFVSPLPQVRSGDVLEMMQLLGAAMGISKHMVRSNGWGESKMIAPNTTEEGQRMNRRVEVIIRH